MELLKDYLIYQGVSELVGSWDTVRAAVTQGILTEAEGTTPMAMLTDRNRTSHLYDEASIRAIENTIAETYQGGADVTADNHGHPGRTDGTE